LETIENPSREKILARISAALATPAPAHRSSTDAAPFLPVGDPLERFTMECAGNNTECVITPNLIASAQSIAEILQSIPEGEIFIQDAPELRRMASDWTSHTIRWSTEPASKDGRDGPNECSQATVTLPEGLVAMTGSVIVSSACGGRGAAMVAPLHIVVAKASQLFPDFDSALAALKQRGTAMRNSYLCFITGSSRTADIEKILVMGAHGPRRLVVTLALNE
jgi:L-lactate utilization protein LutC